MAAQYYISLLATNMRPHLPETEITLKTKDQIANIVSFSPCLIKVISKYNGPMQSVKNHYRCFGIEK